MVSSNPLQPLLPGSALSAQSTSGERPSQPSRSDGEAEAFDDVIALALLEEPAAENADPEITEEASATDPDEKPQVMAGLMPLQDGWLAAMSMMPGQPVTTWQKLDSGSDGANASADEGQIVEIQPGTISVSERSVGSNAGLIDQERTTASLSVEFDRGATAYHGTEARLEPDLQSPQPTSADARQISGKAALVLAQDQDTGFASPSPAPVFASEQPSNSPSSELASHSFSENPRTPPPNPSASDERQIVPNSQGKTKPKDRNEPTDAGAQQSSITTNTLESRPQSHTVSEAARAFASVRRDDVSRGLPKSAGSVPAENEPVTSNAAGTSAAKTSIQSKKPEEMGLPKQHADRTLPDAATLAAVTADPARTKPRSQPGAAVSVQDSSLLVTSTLQAGAFATSQSPTALASDAERLPETSAGDALRLEQKILGVIAEVKRLKPDSMSVVLKPDGDTELHLQLRIDGGRVDVEARVQRGDSAALGGHWAQLQQNLASQGVRLGDLQPPPTPQTAGPDWSGGFSKQHREQTARDELSEPQRESVLPETATVVGKTKSIPKLDRRSWESWA